MEKNRDSQSPEPGPARIQEAATPPQSERASEEPSLVRPKEIGGRKGPDPTRYGDWEKNGRCIDF